MSNNPNNPSRDNKSIQPDSKGHDDGTVTDDELRSIFAYFMECIEALTAEIEGTPTSEDLEKLDEIYKTSCSMITDLYIPKADVAERERLAELQGRLHENIRNFQYGLLDAETYSERNRVLTNKISELRKQLNIEEE